ncbi:ThiF family adenylyltransferase [Gracilibacillus sp. JCM 18860]|uniref:ThiF family adenylyltransferase n=1 Tax=Gracilibacillus sp. JCM 18860 TaxID=1306159 RepID=UPI0006D1A20E
MKEFDRYHKQMLFKPIGEHGQALLGEKHVLIIGCGALGSSIAEMLTRAGIGKLTLIDRDYVEISNLQRQHLFTEADVQKKLPKVIAAQSALNSINAEVTIEAHVMDGNANTLPNLVNNVDLIMDATDNFDTRFLINDIAQKHSIPWIFGACVASSGLSFTIIPEKTPCLDCLIKVAPMFGGATCDAVGGVISPAVQMVVAHQVTEALKILVGGAEGNLRSTLVIFDLWHNQYQMIDVSKAKAKDCKSCGTDASYPALTYKNSTKTEILCGRDTVQIRGKKFELTMLAKQLERFGEVNQNPFLVSVQTKAHRIVFFQDGRTFIHGTNSIKEAKKIYYQMVG